MHVVLEGRANGAMPSWKHLSDTDLAAVVTFVKNHWSNSTDQVIQPAEFVAARDGKFPEGGAAAPAASAPAAAAPAAAASAPGAAASAPATPAAGASAPASAGLPFQVFFATGKSELDGEASNTVKAAAAYLAEHRDAKIALAGFVDSTGGAAANEELAKQRAQAVRDALTQAGVAADRIELRKPQVITAGQGADSQARRVDIAAQ
jgi:cytochrome c oxidase subunit 2